MEFRFFEIYREPEYLFLLAEGVGTSFFITLLAGAFGFILATFLALSRYWEVPVIKYISTGYVEFIRNTPLIVQMFFVASVCRFYLDMNGHFGHMLFLR